MYVSNWDFLYYCFSFLEQNWMAKKGGGWGDRGTKGDYVSTYRLHYDMQNCLLCISNVHTSLWQAGEWGMCGMQGTIPCSKNACQVTLHFAVWSSRWLYLRTILEQTTLVTVKFRLYSCRSTFGSKTFKVMTKSHSVTCVQGSTTVRLMEMGVEVMAKVTKIRLAIKRYQWTKNKKLFTMNEAQWKRWCMYVPI